MPFRTVPTFVKTLRQNATEAKQHLWYRLRAGRLLGHKFRRQVPSGPYIVDFACLKSRLVIELDGGQHADNVKDAARDRWLGSEGYTVLRFWNDEALQQTDAVLARILQALQCDT